MNGRSSFYLFLCFSYFKDVNEESLQEVPKHDEKVVRMEVEVNKESQLGMKSVVKNLSLTTCFFLVNFDITRIISK